MKYVSTRSPKGEQYSFEDVLLMGWAPDGGLFMPTAIPKVSSEMLDKWRNLAYPGLVAEIVQLFVSPDEISLQQLRSIIKDSLRSDMIAAKTLSTGATVLELFHGDTMAFKDLAMSCTARFMDHFLARYRQHLNVLVSTSGDTGAAAIAALRSSPNIDVFVIFPKFRVTELQQLAMTTMAATSDNVHLYAIHGTSDDGDNVMRALFENEQFASINDLSNVNSINWSRVLVQIAHHFYAYFQAKSPATDTDTLEIVCPTGAAGNLAAGFIAQAMGLPIKLVASCNENDTVHQLIETGSLSPGQVYKTLASAMDIQVAYNVERILHILSESDETIAKQFGRAMLESTAMTLPLQLHQKLTTLMSSHRSTDSDIKASMQRCWREEGYLICPHTATALDYHYKHKNGNIHVCLATASYKKFTEALDEAGIEVPVELSAGALLEEMRCAVQKVTELEKSEDWVPTLRNDIEQATAKSMIHFPVYQNGSITNRRKSSFMQLLSCGH